MSILKLTPNNKYTICIPMLDCFNATLISLPRKNNEYYEWQRDDGSKFANRQIDVDYWIKRGVIEEII